MSANMMMLELDVSKLRGELARFQQMYLKGRTLRPEVMLLGLELLALDNSLAAAQERMVKGEGFGIL